MIKNDLNGLFKFIENSPTCFQVAENIKNELINSGFTELQENKSWDIEKDKGYFVIRNNSSIIAFKLPKGDYTGFNICATHGDSPSFKLKKNPEVAVENSYIKLNTEKYGGMNMASWLDRPLSIAGRVLVRDSDRIISHTVNIDRDLLMIPSLAIHMNRDLNNGYKYNEQKDMLPLVSNYLENLKVEDIIKEELNIEGEEIIDSELFLYVRERGIVWGRDNEFISAPRLDNLQCTYAALKGFIQNERFDNIKVVAVFDNEEVGSQTKQGAGSTFLHDVLKRIVISEGKNEEDYLKELAGSFMLSVDGAHALHPNYAEKSDLTNKTVLNKGLVIKVNSSQKYTSDAISAGLFKCICEKGKIPYQMYYNRSDIPGGSTLGNISATNVSVKTADIGTAQLGMHSAYETAGAYDTKYMIDAIRNFYETTVREVTTGEYKF